jgi:hypothetical protein
MLEEITKRHVLHLFLDLELYYEELLDQQPETMRVNVNFVPLLVTR